MKVGVCVNRSTYGYALTKRTLDRSRTGARTHNHTLKDGDAEGAVERVNLRVHVTVIPSEEEEYRGGDKGGLSETAMAFSTVWNYCVPLTIITVAYFVRTGKARPTERRSECDVNEKNVKPVLWGRAFTPCKFAQVF